MRAVLTALSVAAGLAVAAPAFAERAVPGVKGETTPLVSPQRPAARALPGNPRTVPTTGTDFDGMHGYVCRTLIVRREDGGLTKIRRCAD